MDNLLQTLIPILSSIALLLAAAGMARSQTTSFYYDFYGNQPTDLSYQGDAHFPAHSTYLRLTNAQSDDVGRVLYSEPIQFWETGKQVDFETTIKFIITPEGFNTAAEGLAFFIAPVGSVIPFGSEGANLGMFSSSGRSPSVFAVEFDIYAEGAWDPYYPHIGIDLGSRSSINTTELDGAIIGHQVAVRINYTGARKIMDVHVAAGSKTFEVEFEYDLSGFLPQEVQVGLSASTGEYFAIHDIVSWYFTATMVNSVARSEIPQTV